MVTKFKAVGPVVWTSISGATPTLGTEGGTLDNVGATNMSNIILPNGQVDGRIILLAPNANTTILHGLGMLLKGSTNVLVPANGVIAFVKKSTYSNSWIETYRSF